MVQAAEPNMRTIVLSRPIFGILIVVSTFGSEVRVAATQRTDTTERQSLRAEIDKLEKALKIYPNDVASRTAIAVLQRELGNVTAAISQLNRVMSTRVDYKPAYVQAVITYLEFMNDDVAAEVTLQRAFKYFPADGALQSLMGHVKVMQARRHLMEGEPQVSRTLLASARSEFQSAIGNLPNDIEAQAAAYLGLGSAYEFEADLVQLVPPAEAEDSRKAALDAYARALALNPNLASELQLLREQYEIARVWPKSFVSPQGTTHPALDQRIDELRKKARTSAASAFESNKKQKSKK